MADNRLHFTEGQRYGRLTVLTSLGRIGNNRKAICLCDCGVERTVFQANLAAGRTISCGCHRARRASATHRRHGEAGNSSTGRRPTAEYSVWKWMKDRCYNPKANGYPRYGGRGIKVCGRWTRSFEAFLDDMGRRPTPKHQIDRQNNNGDYEPGNCRWATRKEQQANTSRTRKVKP